MALRCKDSNNSCGVSKIETDAHARGKVSAVVRSGIVTIIHLLTTQALRSSDKATYNDVKQTYIEAFNLKKSQIDIQTNTKRNQKDSNKKFENIQTHGSYALANETCMPTRVDEFEVPKNACYEILGKYL